MNWKEKAKQLKTEVYSILAKWIAAAMIVAVWLLVIYLIVKIIWL